jgi:DNA-binding response OmpR family regulator
MSKVTILFADNTPEFLDTRAEFLEDAGYKVLKAYTLTQARQLLADAHIHLAILDIRLVNDDDEKDTSGLTLAKDPAYRPVPKIIITGYPTYEAVREALGPALDGLPPAVAFLAKKEGPEAMIQAVDRALQEQVGISWELQIVGGLEPPPSFRTLVSILESDLAADLLEHREGELEDLFRRLFHEYEQLRIGPVLWQGGGRLCLPVLARSPRGTIQSRLVVCGEPEALCLEKGQVGDLSPTGEQDARLVDSADTMHFGALAYETPNADAFALRPLQNLIAEGGRVQAKAALLSLLNTVRSWHNKGGDTENADNVMALYRSRSGLEPDDLPCSEVEQRVMALVQAVRPMGATEIELDDRALIFHFPDPRTLVCPNPVAFAYLTPEWQGAPVVCKVSPGQLDYENVLVDPQQRIWLTDLAEAGKAPQWWDYVSLEAGVRFNLGQVPDMLACQDLEECLVAPASLQERLGVDGVQRKELQASALLIQEIRQKVAAETGPDILPYYAGLLVWAVAAMARYLPGGLYTRAELMRGAHLLLAAGMIASRMEKLIEARNEGRLTGPEDGGSGGLLTLILEKDGVTVRIGRERRVPLSGQVLKLFRRLNDDAGQVVPRPALVRAALDEEYDSKDMFQERRLNQLVRRLREEIEPEPGKPRYIHAVRGQGYRLVTGREDTD